MTDTDTPLKECKECHQWLLATLEVFPPDKNTLSGLRSLCRECKRKKERKAQEEAEGQEEATTGSDLVMASPVEVSAIADTTAANLTSMSDREAINVINAVKGRSVEQGMLLLQLDLRDGWKALGYESFRDCLKDHFGQSCSYLYQLAAAARVALEVEPHAKAGHIPEWVLRPLSRLKEPQARVEAWEEAKRLSGRLVPGQTDVKAAVEKRLPTEARPVKTRKEDIPQKGLERGYLISTRLLDKDTLLIECRAPCGELFELLLPTSALPKEGPPHGV